MYLDEKEWDKINMTLKKSPFLSLTIKSEKLKSMIRKYDKKLNVGGRINF